MTRHKLDPKVQSHINAVLKSSRHLKNLIDDLLDFTKIESKKVKLYYTEFDVRPLMDDLQNVFSVNLAEGVTIDIHVQEDFPELIRFDELKLRQMLNNLVGNAIKFTRKGNVTVSVAYCKKYDEFIDLTISVKDTGIGISPDKLSLIFKSFEQIENSEGPYRSGTGLGLSITQAYAEMVGGRIEVQSTLGEGSEFTIRIPKIYYRERNLETGIPEVQKVNEGLPELLGKSILIAEDDPTLANLYCEFLIPSNAEIQKVTDGESAMRAIVELIPDLLILDIGLPDKSGVEIAREIRAEKAYAGIPIIALTGYKDMLDHRELFDQILFKPVIKEAFQQAVTGQLMRFPVKKVNEKKLSPLDQSLESIGRDPAQYRRLVDETGELLKQSVASHSISHIRLFKDSLIKFASVYDVESVAPITEELERCLESFDIEGIENSLIKLTNFYSKAPKTES
jgi:CheY-like chemotaxis protein/two-component sensor histidine kinase